MMKLRLVLLLLAPAVLTACGYALVGRGSFLPDYVKEMSVVPFKDRTGWPRLSETLTRAVSERLIRQSGIKISSDESGADAVLQGEIYRFDQQPVAFRDGYAVSYQVIITAGVKVRDLKENKVLYESSAFVFRGEYDVSQDFTTFFDASQESVENIARDFAEQLSTTLLEGF